MSEFEHRLREITQGCRPDMHEPDEQGLTAKIVGDHLDNAMGDFVNEDYKPHCSQEFVVILTRNGRSEPFNLATLIALALR